MADVPFVTFAFPVSSGLTNRTMPARLSDVINVLDYGADPTFSSNSTTQIQNAFNAAFGTAGSPHGLTNAHLNKAVFIPNGHYEISTGPLMLNQVYGGHVFGAGKGATYLDAGQVDEGSILKSNGMSNTCIEGMSLRTQGGGGAYGGAGISLDLYWDGTDAAGHVGLENNVIRDLHIEGGTYGIRIGEGGNGGSGNLILACFITRVDGTGSSGLGGIATTGAEAVNNSVIGGNSGGPCTIGINAVEGGFQLIQGLSAQNFSNSAPGTGDGIDIVLGVDSIGPTVISGCRAEGPTFLKAYSLTQPVLVSGNNSTGGAPHAPLDFVEAHGPCTIESCIVDQSRIMARNAARLCIRNCLFIVNSSGSWLNSPASSLWYTPTNSISANIEIENVIFHEPSDSFIAKQRIFTTNGTALTTVNYTVS